MHPLPLPDLPGARAEIVTPYPLDESSTPRVLFSPLALLPVQTHSTDVRIVTPDDRSSLIEADAFITFTPTFPIGVVTADCVPIVISAPDIQAVAAIHAGWKGTIGGIVDRVIDLLCRNGADPAQMHVAFGPSITPDNYEVSPDLAARFIQAGFPESVTWTDNPDPRPRIDLQDVNIRRLTRLGVSLPRIHPSPYSTFTSARPDGTPLFP
ncbi:MAG: polyphenol oxidase family protein, partial [Muribaculaceae bacterium]|nr:polyphenol oxidase family protein [Muribaculaceae bacterium]